jgi:cytochrome c-type biogenesis protein CcsB
MQFVTLEHAEIGFWIALSLWVAAFLTCLYALVARKSQCLTISVWLAAAGLVPHTAGIVMRWIVTARPPFINLYELVSASAWFAVAAYLVAQVRWKGAKTVGVGVLPVAFISMGAALTLTSEPNALSPTLQSWWLVIHVLFALVAHGCFAISFGAAVLYLVKDHREQTEEDSLIPATDRLDFIGLKCIVFGFICDTIMVLSGAIWAHKAWGRFWGWDPVETWSLVTWLLYGLYIHLHFRPRWRGRRSAIYAIVAFVIVVFSFWGIPHLWTSVHDYTLYSGGG